MKKKNLNLQHCYEFRIRYMVPTTSGKKSNEFGEWSNYIRILLNNKNKTLQSKKSNQSRSSSSSAYSKYYDEDDYDNIHQYYHGNQQNQRQKQQQRNSYDDKKDNVHKQAPDPYRFDYDQADDIQDDSYVYEDGYGYKYKNQGNKKGGKKMEQAEEVEEDPELNNILSEFVELACLLVWSCTHTCE